MAWFLSALGIDAQHAGAFALIGPGLAGTILLMGLVGFSAGLVFVPSAPRSFGGGRRRIGAGP